jgi:hypothetical protein
MVREGFCYCRLDTGPIDVMAAQDSARPDAFSPCFDVRPNRLIVMGRVDKHEVHHGPMGIEKVGRRLGRFHLDHDYTARLDPWLQAPPETPLAFRIDHKPDARVGRRPAPMVYTPDRRRRVPGQVCGGPPRKDANLHDPFRPGRKAGKPGPLLVLFI